MGPSCAQVVHCYNGVHDKTQNLLLFSLKCHPIYPGIHEDPSIGAQNYGCLCYSNGYHGNSWNSKLAILERTCNWASEASPTLGCSIEILRDIYIICVCVFRGPKSIGGIPSAKCAHAQSDL